MLKYILAGILLSSPLLIAGVVCLIVWLVKRKSGKKSIALMVVWIVCFALIAFFLALMAIGGYLVESGDGEQQYQTQKATSETNELQGVPSSLDESFSISDMTAYYPSTWQIVSGEGTDTVFLKNDNGSSAQFWESVVNESGVTSADADELLEVSLMGIESPGETILGDPVEVESNGNPGLMASMVMNTESSKLVGYTTIYLKGGTLYCAMIAYPEGAEQDMEAVHGMATSIEIS